MAKTAQTDKPRIFISHAWEDKPLVRRLEAELRAVDAEVWVDHSGIRGGDNLPERISEALEWCNSLLLIWSDAASNSRWVKLEWTNAISLEKAIIPCQLEATKLPAMLAHKAYIDFRNIDRGIAQLLHSLRLARQADTSVATNAVGQVASVIHNRLVEIATPVKQLKPSQISLRSQPLIGLSVDKASEMLKAKDFFHGSWNPHGKGLQHQYKADEQKKIVIDHATGLMWQQSGSSDYMNYVTAEKHIRKLNKKHFADYNDWRLPTLEEAMSLIESQKYSDLYIDPIFDRRHASIWTADKANNASVWLVEIGYGMCRHGDIFHVHHVRAVR